jgi:hypothetical protein
MRYAAREVDPLSWFVGANLPIVFAAFVAVWGSAATGLTWGQSEHPALQLVAVLLCTVACVLPQLLAAPRRRVDWRLGVVVLLVASSGLILSAVGYAGSSFVIERWWAPFCFALVFAALMPSLAPWRLLVWGAGCLVTVVVVAAVIVGDTVPQWGPLVTYLFVAAPVIVGAAGSAAFAFRIVRTLLPMVDNRSTALISRHLAPDPEDQAAERASLARLTARAVPFVRSIAERGTVEEGDRALAAEIARQLRDDLVSRSDLAWLGLRADDTRVVVVDPDRRAPSMRAAQRTAIRDLVQAVLDDPATDATTVSMELRAQPDGSTAVAITLDADLPDGRRVRHLAPYYFNLRGEMRNVRLGRDRFSFHVPPEAAP